MSQSGRMFAVIPAAGHSRRMGIAKLLLPLGKQTAIGRLLQALDRPDIADRLVVLRRDDELLRDEVIRCGGAPVQPALDPPDMRASVEHALREIRRRHAPHDSDGWLLVPADHPLLAPAVLDSLLARWIDRGDRILVPTFGGRRGHPVVFRWHFADEVSAIPPGRGLNWLLDKYRDRVAEFAVEDDSILLDMDTPADFAAAEQAVRALDDRDSKIEDRKQP